MKISTKTRYGMRFMIDLAGHYGQGCTALKDVADRQGISKKYLEQVVAPLSSAGLLTVTRGYLGGYELSRNPRNITLADIVSASEDGLIIMDCLGEDGSCARQEFCPSRKVWNGMEQAIRTYLESLTLADIVEDPSLITAFDNTTS